MSASLVILCGTPSDQFFSGGSAWGTPPLRYGQSFSYAIPWPAMYASVTLKVAQPQGVASTSPDWIYSLSAAGLQNVVVDVNNDTENGTVVATYVFTVDVSPDGYIHLQFAAKSRNAVVSQIIVGDLPAIGQEPVLVVPAPSGPGNGPSGYNALAVDAAGYLYVSTPVGAPAGSVSKWRRTAAPLVTQW